MKSLFQKVIQYLRQLFCKHGDHRPGASGMTCQDCNVSIPPESGELK